MGIKFTRSPGVQAAVIECHHGAPSVKATPAQSQPQHPEASGLVVTDRAISDVLMLNPLVGEVEQVDRRVLEQV